MKRMQGKVFLMNSMGQADVFTVHRAATVVWVDGIPQETAVNTYQMTGNIQPLPGKDLLLVPEAQRTKENRIIFTEQNAKTPLLNDRVCIEGAFYQVQEVANWGTYSRLRVTKEDAKAGR